MYCIAAFVCNETEGQVELGMVGGCREWVLLPAERETTLKWIMGILLNSFTTQGGKLPNCTL